MRSVMKIFRWFGNTGEEVERKSFLTIDLSARRSARMGIKMKIKSVIYDSQGICFEYARPGSGGGRTKEIDWAKEREKMKEALLPFVKEAVRKQLKEEREYYKSRPSLAAKHMEQVFGANRPESVLVSGVALRVYEKVEERLRLDAMRKGR